jgi:tetratricopeptide (TPR) repeat protein
MAKDPSSFEFKVTPLSENVILIGSQTGNSNCLAINTKKGLVMVDSMWSPSVAKEARTIIQKKFGKTKFHLLILTAGNILNTGGTAAFPEAKIIAHKKCYDALQKRKENIIDYLKPYAEEFSDRIERTTGQLKKVDPDSQRAQSLQHWIDLCVRVRDDLKQGYSLRLPSEIIEDRKQIDLDGITLELVYFGEAGNYGDLLVKVPEEGLVFLGDVFHALHVLPYVSTNTDIDLERWVEVLSGILNNSKFRNFVRSNGPEVWGHKELSSRYQLMKDINQLVHKADKEKSSLEVLMDRLKDYKKIFPYTAEWPHGSLVRGDILRIAQSLWRQDHNSAVDEIAKVIKKRGLKAARERYKNLKADKGNNYYFLENEFNALGYKLLREKKNPLAVEIFKMMVEMYPQSSNAYDSLGEAYMISGQKSLAIKNYQLSLKLDPRNENAKKMISRMEKTDKNDFPHLEGPYMGQKPPGHQPEIFLPGILNTKKKGAFCTVFTTDLKEFYCVCYHRGVEKSGFIYIMQNINNLWTPPKAVGFSKRGLDNDMALSADGNRMIFRSWRALPDGSKPKNHSWLWVVERTKEDWGEAKPFLCGGVPVRTGYPSIASNGSVYFAFRGDKGLGIYQSKLTKTGYNSPEFVTKVISSEVIHGDMFVAPDESYLIVSCRDEEGKIGYGLLDLYILFKRADGSWTQALNMGKEINTSTGGENCPQVSPDGRYLFFNRYDPQLKVGNMYWLDADIIKRLKSKALK